MDDKNTLKVECSTIAEETTNISLGEKYHLVIGQPIQKTPPNDISKERFIAFNHTQQTNVKKQPTDKTGLRANLLKKDTNKLKEKYQQAINHINPVILNTLKMVDYNLVAVQPIPIDTATRGRKNIMEFYEKHPANTDKKPIWRYLQKIDFNDNLSVEEKNSCYIAIRDYLFLEYSKNNINTQIAKEDICEQHLVEKISPLISDFLFKISCGNLKTIKQLAKLWAQIQYKFPKINPTVILADKSIHNSLIDFFDKSSRICEVELFEIINKKGKIGLFRMNINNYISAFLSVNSPLPLSYSKTETLRKIMKGQKINVKHPEFSGDLFVYNRIPFIYITDSHENYNILKYQYGAKAIELSGKNASYIHQISNTEWLNNDFAIFGKSLHNSEYSISVAKPKIIEDNIIEKFIKELCVLDKTLDIPKAKLFEVYQEYFTKNYGNTSLSKKQFNSKIAIIADLDECRPHHNNKSNPRCFKGINIDNKKYKDFLKAKNGDKYICDFTSFNEALYDMMYKNLLSEADFNYHKKQNKKQINLEVEIKK